LHQPCLDMEPHCWSGLLRVLPILPSPPQPQVDSVCGLPIRLMNCPLM
jgi:hypothetical protein